jgi:hypothetical protein
MSLEGSLRTASPGPSRKPCAALSGPQSLVLSPVRSTIVPGSVLQTRLVDSGQVWITHRRFVRSQNYDRRWILSRLHIDSPSIRSTSARGRLPQVSPEPLYEAFVKRAINLGCGYPEQEVCNLLLTLLFVDDMNIHLKELRPPR